MDRKIGVIFVVLLVVFFAATAMAKKPSTEKRMETLGQQLCNNKKLSLYSNQSCFSCHHRSSKFADPDNRKNPVDFPVSEGSILGEFGGRNAPTAAYAGFSPKLNYNGVLFIGGLFWDGRASGLATTVTGGLGAGPTFDPLADQCKGPFLNPVEMALPDAAAVVNLVQSTGVGRSFEKVFGPGAFADVGQAYNNIATAIAAFERSSQVNKFNSKFDKFRQEQGGDVSTFGVEVDPATGFRKYVGPPNGFKSKHFSYNEADGLALFNADSYTQSGTPPAGANGGMCYLCHLTENHVPDPVNSLVPNQVYPPLFTDFSYDNLGIPVNPRIAELKGGPQPIDYGLGDKSRVAELQTLNLGLIVDAAGYAADEIGKFRVSTLRDCAKTAPYGHNGFFPTIYSIVHFYNTRDNPWPGESWPAPEVAATVNNTELGNLGLTLDQENNIVAFLETLTDK